MHKLSFIVYSTINVQDGIKFKITENDSGKYYLRYGLYNFTTILLFYLNTVFLKKTFRKMKKFWREEKNIRNFQFQTRSKRMMRHHLNFAAETFYHSPTIKAGNVYESFLD